MATFAPVLGTYESSLEEKKAGNSSSASRVATDKDTFLKLLVAQLTHQDPLNPVEDKEFIAQLAQFTQVEELQNLNTSMASLSDAYARTNTANAASMLGMYVDAKGDTISFDGTSEKSSSFTVYFPEAVDSGTFTVYATNDDGSIGKQVFTAPLNKIAAGQYLDQSWDGKDNAGNVMAKGIYIVSYHALNADGEQMLAETTSSGQVVGLETAADGNHKMFLSDGRSVFFNNVNFLTHPSFLNSSNGTGSGTDTNADTETTP